MTKVATRQRAIDRGAERSRETVNRLSREFRDARRSHGLSQRAAAAAAGVSVGWIAMFERGTIANPGLLTVSIALAVVGLDFSGRAFASGTEAMRDAGH